MGPVKAVFAGEWLIVNIVVLASITNDDFMIENLNSDYLPDNAKRILLVSLGGIGDTIMFSPVFKAVKNRYPDASVDLLLSNRLAQSCFVGAKEIDCFFVVNTNHKNISLKIASFLSFAFSARFRERYDLCVYEASLKPYWYVLLHFLAGIKTHIRYPVVADGLAPNVAIARLFDPGIDKSDAFISVTEEAQKEAATECVKQKISWNNESLLAIYPSTQLAHRPRWPLQNMVAVVTRLKQSGLIGRVVVVGSAVDGQEWEAVHGADVVDANLAGKISLLASAAVLEKCSLALCNDGGIMHVAGAVGCPLVAIMPNAPSSFCPPGKHTIMIHPRIPCAPCYPLVPKKCPDFQCRNAISVDSVYDACVQLLNITKKVKSSNG